MISKNVCKLLGYQWRAVCFRSSHPSFPLVSFRYQPPLSRALACRQYTLSAWKKVLSCILAWLTGCWSIYRLEWQPYKPHNNKILFLFIQPHKEAAAETEKWLKWDCKSTTELKSSHIIMDIIQLLPLLLLLPVLVDSTVSYSSIKIIHSRLFGPCLFKAFMHKLVQVQCSYC